MLKVIFVEQTGVINLKDIKDYVPIFARDKKTCKLRGMVIEDINKGWIVRIGGDAGSCGYSETRQECLQKASRFYDFFVESE